MFEHTLALLPELWLALGQTLAMMAIALGAALLLGGPLGVLLFAVADGRPLQNRPMALLLGWIVNMVRSFPFLVLLVALVPVTRAIAGSAAGPLAAAVPLSVAAVPYFARRVEQSLCGVPRGVIDAARAMGASELQIVLRVLLPEARCALVLGVSALAIALLSTATVAGALGGGGIGALAIRVGQYRGETDILVISVAVLVALVQLIQFGGSCLARRIDHRQAGPANEGAH